MSFIHTVIIANDGRNVKTGMSTHEKLKKM